MVSDVSKPPHVVTKLFFLSNTLIYLRTGTEAEKQDKV